MEQEETKPVCMAGFKEWLAGTDNGAFHYQSGESYYTLIRVAKNEDFDYLYEQRRYRFASLLRNDSFSYAGVYCKRDGKAYDWQRHVGELEAGGVVNGFDSRALQSALKENVRRAVEAAVGNDRANLRVTEVADEQEVKRLLEFQRHYAPGLARSYYLSQGDGMGSDGADDGGYVFVYTCGYNPVAWTEDSLLEYILDPAGYAKREADAYFDRNQIRILASFLEGDMIAAEYNILMANPQNPIHAMRRIIQATRGADAKTFSVTILKGGTEMTFKAEADQFRTDCGSANHYSNYLTAAADRRVYEEAFGRYNDYGPADIVRITYARRAVYEAAR